MEIDISKNISLFLDGKFNNDQGREPDNRYSSFDYCYNYFQSYREGNNLKELANPNNIEYSCLQLAFYLASWGMIRGSTLFLQKSVKWLEPLIVRVSQLSSSDILWLVDVDSYNQNSIQSILDFKVEIVDLLKDNGREPTDIMITKIMLGIFANVPAFDTMFKKGLGFWKFDENTLFRLHSFYIKNQSKIDECKIYTIDYKTSIATTRQYRKAKIIDMIGFIEGFKKAEAEKALKKL